MVIRKHMVGGGVQVISNAEDVEPDVLTALLDEGVADLVEIIADDGTVVDRWARKMH